MEAAALAANDGARRVALQERLHRIDAGAASELQEGEKRVLDVQGRRILVMRSEGEYFACSATCTHEPMALDEGSVMLGTIECPLHGAVFDLRTGTAEFGPAEHPLPVFPCRVQGGRVVVEVPETSDN